MPNGYAGKILEINLTDKIVRKTELSEKLKKEFIGGQGINSYLFHSLASPKVNALSPDNPVIIGAGPLVGTAAPSSPKTILTTKSPQSQTILSSPTGELGHMLKYAGYDHLVITGKAANPVYITIMDDAVDIVDAQTLWGKDIFDTTDELHRRHGNCSVAAIGPAGENLVTFSLLLINKVATWGRGGAGAVFGSKNLKALVVKGTKGLNVAQPKELLQLVNSWVAEIKKSPNIEQWTRYGLIMAWEAWMATGKLTIDNWGGGYPIQEATEYWGPQAYEKEIREGSLSCPSCFVGCKGKLKLREGELAGLKFLSSNPFAISEGFGSRLKTGKYSFSGKAYELCNRLGMDLGSFSSKMEFVYFLYEKGVIDKKVLQGWDPGLGFTKVIDMLYMVAHRKGIGDVLARTWSETVELLGKETEEYAVHIKGVDPTMDIRGYKCTENIGQLTSNRGGHAMGAQSITIVPGRKADALRRYGKKIGVPDSISDRVFEGENYFHPSRLLKWVEDYNTLFHSLGICNRAPVANLYALGVCREFYTAVTGISISEKELIVNGGEKINNAERLFNLEAGFGRKDDMPPKRFMTEPLIIAGREYPPFSEFLANSLLDDYYDERGWTKDGIPERELLTRLGLQEMYEKILL